MLDSEAQQLCWRCSYCAWSIQPKILDRAMYLHELCIFPIKKHLEAGGKILKIGSEPVRNREGLKDLNNRSTSRDSSAGRVQ